MKYNLGIDESGRFFVGAISPHRTDVTPGTFAKIRNISGDDPLFAGFSFRFVFDRSDILAPETARLIAYSELIRSFSENVNLDSVYIDGELSEKQKDTLERIIWQKDIPRIKSGSHYDTTYRLVNGADHIANLLCRHFESKKGHIGHRLNGYLEHMVTPKIEEYLQLLRKSDPPDMRQLRKSKGYFNRTGRIKGRI